MCFKDSLFNYRYFLYRFLPPPATKFWSVSKIHYSIIGPSSTTWSRLNYSPPSFGMFQRFIIGSSFTAFYWWMRHFVLSCVMNLVLACKGGWCRFNYSPLLLASPLPTKVWYHTWFENSLFDYWAFLFSFLMTNPDARHFVLDTKWIWCWQGSLT